MSYGYVWLHTKKALTGGNDLRAAGQSMLDYFTKLPATLTTAEGGSNPAGDDDIGAEFNKWYGKEKTALVDAGKEIGTKVAKLGVDVITGITDAVQTDDESSRGIKV